jgi:hypothetical protein
MNIKSDTEQILDDIEPYTPNIAVEKMSSTPTTPSDATEDAATTQEATSTPDATATGVDTQATVAVEKGPAPQLAHRRHDRLKAMRVRREQRLKQEAQAKKAKQAHDEKMQDEKTVLPFSEDGWAAEDPVHPTPPGRVRVFLES